MLYVKMGVCKKPSLDEAEDIVGGNAGFFWLLDGATPPLGELNHKHTRQFVEEMNKALLTYSTKVITPKELLLCALNEVNKSLFSILSRKCEHLPYSTIIIVKLFNDCIDYIILGDSFLGIRINENTLVVCDDRLKKIAIKERAVVQELRANGVDENSREYLVARKQLIEAEKRLQNCNNGYWVVGNQANAVQHAIAGKISYNKEDDVMIIMVSDGLERLVSIFDIYKDICCIGDVLTQKGQDWVFNQLRILEGDRNNFKKSISSQHDDASYVLIQS